MKTLSDMNVKLFADGSDSTTMLQLNEEPYIKGLTTNPTLMNQAGIKNYRAFCQDILTHIKDKPISFEVFSDDFMEMERQAMEIASWGNNVYVKIPVMNTKGEPSSALVRRLVSNQIKVNVTALMTLDQVRDVMTWIDPHIPSYISIFAGRIADTGRDPLPILSSAVELLKDRPHVELIWASSRELLNIVQADAIGCHVITVTSEILKKLSLIGRDLHQYSLDTVKMFHHDGLAAGFEL